ncbi:nicotinate-nucleotide adenylyltransferase [Spirosoma aureum]|uniref:Nicotinate-nucleotide adenylyltransferase n=1 Tax=Spirosoma aureum TaxID=2692134 RepID=A0A6G9AMP5_9BACT|nr:nicotinate-nucleotide adenylyltransferase [Spirosoma aureum]QIP13727.1 nicotinate-nucleotide adenylyltransferase [Spirosoma aureum]
MNRQNFFVSFCVLILGLSIQSFAQVLLPEIKVLAVNYKYLGAVNNKAVAVPVKQLERKAAVFDLKDTDFYEDEYDNYFVTFFIPEGKILAAYDKNGKLLHTAEKFKNIALPLLVSQSVAKKYPNWHIAKDVYLVNYHESNGVTKKYKILLENGTKRMRIKTNEKGEFI